MEKLKGVKVLYVDDDPTGTYMIAIYVEKFFGGTFTGASNGKEAIELLRKESFDVVLLDINMPDMDGYETAKIMREIDKNVPIIAVTAQYKRDDAKYFASRMNDYLVKPFSIDDLYKTMIQCGVKRR